MKSEHAITEADLLRLFPLILWREPLPIMTPDTHTDYGCRFCIAIHGLHAGEVLKHPKTRAEFDAHMKEHCP